MKKILLIEDRTQRQQLFMNATKIDLNFYSNILNNTKDEKYEDLVEKLKDDTYNFDEYSIIICHKSAFEEDNTIIIDKLEKYCQDNQKVLVLFSGGIDANYYSKDEGFELIEVNSKTFYSENLPIFLEDFRSGNLHPLILCYGDKWKLNIALNILEKLNMFIEKTDKDKVLYSAFMRDNEDIKLIEAVQIGLYKPLLDERKISKEEIIKLRDSILNYINEGLLYE